MKKWMIAFSIVLVFVFCFTSIVSAQGEKPPKNPDQPPLGLRARLAAWRYPGVFKAFSQALADELGLIIEELKERVENGETPLQIAQSEGLSEEEFQVLLMDVREGLLVQAIEDGKITEEQAEMIRQRWEEGITKGVLARMLRSQAGELIAKELGLSKEAIQERLQNGETMLEIAQSQGWSEEEFQTLMKEVQVRVIDQAVDDSILTQEQAEKLKKILEERGGFFRGIRKHVQNMPGKDLLLPRLAGQLGLDWEDLQDRLADGETWPEIMEDLGLEREDIRKAMDELGTHIIQKAHESVLISPEREKARQEGGMLKPLRWLQKSMRAVQRFRMKLLEP